MRRELANFHKAFFFYVIFWIGFKLYLVKIVKFESYFSFVGFFVGAIVLWFVYLIMAIFESIGGKNAEI